MSVSPFDYFSGYLVYRLSSWAVYQFFGFN